MTGDVACGQATRLGAYVLGALPPDETAEVDAHLSECPACAAELSELETLPSVLGQLDVDDVVADPPAVPDDLFDRIAGAVQASERQQRTRRLLAAAAAVVVAAGTAIGVTAAMSGGGSPPPLPSFSAAAGDVRMSVALDAEATGTQLRIAVTGLPEGEHCHLIAVSTDGSRDAAGSWTATYRGRAAVTGWTSYRPAQLARLVLVGDHHQRLVTVRT
jgi:hypothetical protein